MTYRAKLTNYGRINVVPDIYIRCVRCNRLLKTDEAKERGYGKTCWLKSQDQPKNVLF